MDRMRSRVVDRVACHPVPETQETNQPRHSDGDDTQTATTAKGASTAATE